MHLTLNCEGVSRVLKSGEEAILSSRVCRKTLWKSNISGRLPNRLSILTAEWGSRRIDGGRERRGSRELWEGDGWEGKDGDNGGIKSQSDKQPGLF